MAGTPQYDWDEIKALIEADPARYLTGCTAMAEIASRLPGEPSRQQLAHYFQEWGWGSTIRQVQAHFSIEGRPPVFEEYEPRPTWEEERALILGENKRLRSTLDRAQGLNALIVQAIEERCVRIPPFEPPRSPVPGGSRRPESANLDLSDVHLGEVVRAEQTGGLSTFDWATLEAEAVRLREAVFSIVDRERAGGPVPILNVNALGDLVTNEDIYQGQSRDIDRILVDQIFDGAHLLINELLLPFLRYFEEVRLYAVWGNHGRLSSKKGEKASRSNADYILYRLIATLLERFEHFHPYISQSAFMGFRLPEAPQFTHLLMHGDSIRSYMSLPFYGLERMVYRMISATSIVWDYVHVGHFHREAEIDLSHGETIVNGSWVGATEYSVNKMQGASQPKQLLFGMHPEWGMVWRYPIQLRPRSRLTVDDEGFYTPVWKGGRG